MAIKQNRDFIMSVKLTTDMRDKLAFVADSLGQAPATVASFAIGQYVAAQTASLKATSTMGESMAKAMVPALAELFQSLNPEPESENPCSSSKVYSVQPRLSAVEPIKKPVKSSLKGKSFKSKPSTAGDSLK
jgi:predicted transcriptional regulator